MVEMTNGENDKWWNWPVTHRLQFLIIMMAPISATVFRLTHIAKSIILNNTISQNLTTTGNRLLIHNARVYSNNIEHENSFSKRQENRKKTVPISKILLISEEGKVVGQITLEEAQNLAKRRNLNLVKVVDVSFKSTLPTYKLLSKVQLLNEKSTAKQNKVVEKNAIIKQTKDFILSNKIEQHDLEVKINSMIKLLLKRHKIQIYVTMSPDNQMLENIKLIETRLGESGELSKKVKTGAGVKLYFNPKVEETIK